MNIMSKLKYMYNSIVGKRILSSKEEIHYKDTLADFLKSADKYLYYDTLRNTVLLLNETEMRGYYQNGNYQDYGDLINNFGDFCVNCCVEVLKEFSNYSFEEIEHEFVKHDILKVYVF